VTTEWAELAKPAPELRGLLRSHIQILGLQWHKVSLEPNSDPGLAPFTKSLDVMGDGSLVLLPTPGHTAGSMSLLVRRACRPPLCWSETSLMGRTSSNVASFPVWATGGGSRKARAKFMPWRRSSRT
jgi:hypothetical protein